MKAVVQGQGLRLSKTLEAGGRGVGRRDSTGESKELREGHYILSSRRILLFGDHCRG